ncbi:MAG: outer membrane lipoprotein carrier protein LolA [Deltaproteobacteria bacterium]|nr:outer membrane lipoprotein carrier protein LolA [Deltaproteobacteria bacterium]
MRFASVCTVLCIAISSLSGAWAVAAPAPVAAADLAGLLKSLAQMPGLQAQFVEKKTMALLAAPLVTTGALYYTQPGMLARHTATPAMSVVVVDAKQVRMWDGKRWEVLDFAKQPVVRGFVDSFVRILQGDAPALERLYAMQFAALPAGRWTLTLRPKQAPLSQVVEFMTLAGQGLAVQSMRMVELGGDETVTTFAAVDTARKFSDAEKTKYFPQPGR